MGVLLLTGTAPRARADSITVGGQTGSQIFIDATTGPRLWNFGVTQYGSSQGVTIDSFLPYMSASINNTNPLVISLYDGLGGTGNVIASSTSAASNWSNTFTTGTMPLGSPATLTAGYYSIAVSNTSAGGRGFLFKPSTASLTGTSGAVLTAALWISDTNTSGNAGTTLATSGTVLANPWLSGTSVNFGNYRYDAASSGTATVALVNDALATSNNMTQWLAGTGSASATASFSGLPTSASALSVGGTTNLTVGLGRGVVGPNNGSVVLNFSSVSGSSSTTGTTALTPTYFAAPVISLTGTGYDWANAKVVSGTLGFGNVRTGASLANQTTVVGNQTVTNASYQDLLNVSGSTSNAAVTVGGFSNLAASTNGATTGTVSLAANTATAGSLASSVALTFTSNANGVAGLSNGSATFAGGSAPTIASTGGVYDFATAVFTGTTLAFGTIHQGATGIGDRNVAFGNQTITNASYQDSLDVSGTTANARVTATGFTGLAASAGGASTQNLVVTVDTSTAGSLASTLTLSLVSNANGVVGLSDGTATTIGGGAIVTSGQVYTGQSVWNTNGSGQWGTLSNNFGTNWQTDDGSPGLDSSFTNTDTATFAGAATSGTAVVTITAATPSLRSLQFSNGVASYVVAGDSGGALAMLNSGTSMASIDVTAGSHTIASDIALNSRTDFDVAVGARLNASGNLTGSEGLLKTGDGVLSITGVNLLTGTTTVASGTLNVNGTLASSFVDVQAGATLTGSGTVGNTVVFGIQSPGNSPGVQTTGDLTYENGASLVWELIANDTSGRGTNYDGIDVLGALAFSGTTSMDLSFNSAGSTVDWNDAFWATSHTGTNGWLVYAGATSLSGFSRLIISGTNWTDSNGNMLRDVQADAGFTTYQSGNDVYLNYSVVAVPEPSALLLAGLGMGLAAAAERRRRVTRTRGTPATGPA
jgi:fibronectin-binding autotransporter adhesin